MSERGRVGGYGVPITGLHFSRAYPLPTFTGVYRLFTCFYRLLFSNVDAILFVIHDLLCQQPNLDLVANRKQQIQNYENKHINIGKWKSVKAGKNIKNM